MTARKVEWGAEAAEDALTAIGTRDLATVELMFSDAMLAVSGSLRGLFVAAPGHELICADYSAIEAVGLAMLAGEQWRIDVFRTHGRIYEASAAQAFHVPLDEILNYPAANGGAKHHLRAKGKGLELACFSPETQVLTDSGYMAIVDITEADKLWDGVEWVNHEGLIPRGRKRVLKLDGVRMTPQHKVLCGTSWLEASQLASHASTLCRSLATGSENLPSSCANGTNLLATGTSSANATAASSLARRFPIFTKGRLPDAINARFGHLARRVRRTLNTLRLFLTTTTVRDYSIGTARPERAANAQLLNSTRAMAAGGFACGQLGSVTGKRGSNTSLPLKGGMTHLWTSIESIMKKVTNLETYDSSAEKLTAETNERSQKCKLELLTLSDVYDIAHAGPRNRFTIKTDSGHLIVHNCGYQGWLGSAKAFGVPGTDDEIKTAILAWRAASPSVEFLWGGQAIDPSTRTWHEMAKAAGGSACAGQSFDAARQAARACKPWDRQPYRFGCEGMLLNAIQTPNKVFPVYRLDGTYSGISYERVGDVVYMILPDDSTIAYHRPRLQPSKDSWRGLSITYEGWNTNPKNGPPGWIRMGTWGGRQVENGTQGICNRIQRFSQINLERIGYPCVQHVYDENAAEVPIGFGSIEEFCDEMDKMPPFAADWPVKVDRKSAWRGRRYRK